MIRPKIINGAFGQLKQREWHIKNQDTIEIIKKYIRELEQKIEKFDDDKK